MVVASIVVVLTGIVVVVCFAVVTGVVVVIGIVVVSGRKFLLGSQLLSVLVVKTLTSSELSQASTICVVLLYNPLLPD